MANTDQHPDADADLRLLSTRDVSEITGLKEVHLRQLRLNGGGPRFVKIGRLVKYKPADVRAWIDSHPAYDHLGQVAS